MEEILTDKQAPGQYEEPIDLKQAAEFLGISRSSFFKLLKEGKIKGHKVLSDWKFFKSELTAQIKIL